MFVSELTSTLNAQEEHESCASLTGAMFKEVAILPPQPLVGPVLSGIIFLRASLCWDFQTLNVGLCSATELFFFFFNLSGKVCSQVSQTL